MRRRDFVVVGCVLALALILFLLTRSGDPATGRVLISVDGTPFAEGRIGQKQDIVIRGPDGEENIVRITENGVYMASSTCKNQLCVQQGEVTRENFRRRALGNRIICLPNRVVVEMETSPADREGAPDA